MSSQVGPGGARFAKFYRYSKSLAPVLKDVGSLEGIDVSAAETEETEERFRLAPHQQRRSNTWEAWYEGVEVLWIGELGVDTDGVPVLTFRFDPLSMRDSRK